MLIPVVGSIGKKHRRQGAMAELRRKLYRRGSSYETTIPMPLLFALDLSKKHDIIFTFDTKASRWYLGFERMKEKKEEKNQQKK